MRKFFSSTILLSLVFGMVSISHALIVEVPSQYGQEDIVVNGPTQITGDESNVFDIIQLVNRYLWFAVSVVCMGVLVYGGYVLITASGDEKKMQQANKLLTGALIGIAISLFSYAIVRIVVNLLA